MKLANTCGFVNGIRQDYMGSLGNASRSDVFKVRNTPLEPMVIDKVSLSLSEQSTTDPGTMLHWHSSVSGMSDGEPAFVSTWPAARMEVDARLPVRVPKPSRLDTTPYCESLHKTEQGGDEAQLPAIRSGKSKSGKLDKAGPPKSLGSVLHPNGCKECHFYVFNAAGCKAGKDCDYCHELHPRKNAKKNRRYMHKQKESLAAEKAKASKGEGEQMANDGVVEDSTDRRIDPLLDERAVTFLEMVTEHAEIGRPVGRSYWGTLQLARQEPSVSSSSTISSGSNTDDIQNISLWYTEIDPILGTQKPLILVTDVRTHFPAHVEFSAGNGANLEDNVEFTVSPPLPEGLILDAATGMISGVPVAPQDSSLHRIIVSINSFAPSGIFLGKLPLTGSTISICIVDLQSCVATCFPDSEGTEQISLLWQK